MDPELKFKNGETIENNVATKWAKDTLGIDIKSLWSVTDTNNAFATKLRLAMSSGQEMPDVVTIGDAQLAQDLIDSGMFREVGSLFDKYASDTWKKAMEQDPNVWNPYIRDGQKMGIPVLDYAYNHDYLLWIRKDWLDKLGLAAPKTIDELEKVMDAFKNKNPDGLKPDEVIPLSIGFKTTMNTWMGDPSWIFGAYGTIPQQWNKGQDGKLEYGSINPAMKPGLQKLNEWFNKGYIPKEAALWDENKTSEPSGGGQGGDHSGALLDERLAAFRHGEKRQKRGLGTDSSARRSGRQGRAPRDAVYQRRDADQQGHEASGSVFYVPELHV